MANSTKIGRHYMYSHDRSNYSIITAIFPHVRLVNRTISKSEHIEKKKTQNEI